MSDLKDELIEVEEDGGQKDDKNCNDVDNDVENGENLSPLLFVDTSYLSFYRFFATKRWMQFAHPDIDLNTIVWDQCDVFMEKYEIMYMKSLERFIREWNIPYENIFFVKDCPRCEIWRNKIYSNYKGTREAANKSFTGGLVFKYTHSTILPSIEERFKCKSMRVDTAEADDIIAVCKKHIREKYPKRQIVIITSDTDYVQLLDENTEILNLRNVSLKKKSTGCRELDLFIKSIRGDKCDNIPSCFKRVGEKTAIKYFNDRKLLESMFEKFPSARTQYELNCNLIDFDNIPKELCDTILETFVSLN